MKRIIYRVEVTVTLPLALTDDDPDHFTEAQAVSQANRIALEKSLFKAVAGWAKGEFFNAEIDGELMDFDVDEDLHGPDCACETCQHERARDASEERERYEDDGREYGHPDDFRRGLE